MTTASLYFGILLLLASLFMGGLATVTCVQVFRLRNRRLSWRAGTLGGLPLFSTLFMMISFPLALVSWFHGDLWHIAASVLYLFFSVSWFVSSYFSSKRYITDHGIVKNINDPAQTVPWHQMHDFFEQEQGSHVRYVFMYRQHEAKKTGRVIRLRLLVPKSIYDDFKKLLSHKLGRRLSCYENEMIDVESFD